MFIIKRKNLIIFSFLILYKLLLDLSYIGFIHKIFEYMGFVLDFNIYKYIFSIVIFILMYNILPKNNEKPSSILLQLHFLIMIMPMFTIYAFMNESNLFFLISMLMFSFQCILLKVLPNIKIVRIKKSKSILYIMVIGITVFVYFSMIRANGMPTLKALNLLDVYDIRGSVSYPFLMAYLVNWQAKVINPFLIATSYLNKNKILLIISISLQLLLYLITAHKSFILIPFAILFVMKVTFKWDFLKISSKTATLGVIGTLVFYEISNSLTIPSLLLRRFLFVPAQIKFYYYDFFSKNEFIYFSQGALGKIFGVKYPYNMNSANMIGDIYFNNAQTYANSGYIADAYANMGIIGMLIIAILFIFILNLIDSLSIAIGRELTVGLTLFSVLSLNDGALLTTLLTGGLLFLLCVLYLYSSSSLNKE